MKTKDKLKWHFPIKEAFVDSLKHYYSLAFVSNFL